MSFGKWIKDKRKARGWSQEKLAEMANYICTGGYISSLEREADIGKSGRPTQPSIEVVDALATALGEPIPDARLVAGYAPTSQPAIEDALANALLYKYDQLPEEDKDKIRPLLEMLDREISRHLPGKDNKD